jgi:nitroreductase
MDRTRTDPTLAPREREQDAGEFEAFRSATMDRRHFLVLAGGLAAGAAIAPRLAWAKRAVQQLGTGPMLLQPWSLPAEAPGNALDIARALVGAAVLAPSDWNSQPWRFEVEASSLRLVPDPARLLPRTDPDGRGVMVSLGAALENLLVAARAYGLRPTVNYFPRGATGPVAEVVWAGGDQKRDLGLFAAIPARRTNRRNYDGRGLLPDTRAQLTAQVPEGLALHWLDDRDAIRTVAKLAHDSQRELLEDRAIAGEQYRWMRFGNDARRRGDGVPIESLELGVVTSWMARRYFNPRSWFARFGPEHAAREVRDGVRSAGSLALLTAPRRDSTTWLMGGQAFERFALQAAALGLALQPVSAPIARERYRPALLKAFEATGEEPLVLARLGHAPAPPPVPRRSVALVATFRTS